MEDSLTVSPTVSRGVKRVSAMEQIPRGEVQTVQKASASLAGKRRSWRNDASAAGDETCGTAGEG